jgi:hypothetical protein
MKTLTHFGGRGDKTFHMPPSSVLFALIASSLLALVIVLVLSVYVK